MTVLSTLSRQLSVLIFALLAVRAAAQGSVGMRNVINNQPAMVVPGMGNTPPTMFISSLTVQPTKRSDLKLQSFYFNADLTLGVQYNYAFTFDFKVDSGRGLSPVPDGWYLLTVATFLKDGRMYDNPSVIDPNETLEDRYTTSSRPRLVHVENGAARPDISLRFDNPSRASVDNTLYVEFRPVVCPPRLSNCIAFDADGQPDLRNSRWVPARGFSVRQHLLSLPWVPATGTTSGGTDPRARTPQDTEILRATGLDTFANKVEIARANNPRAQRSLAPLPPAKYAAKYNLKLYDVEDADIYDAGQAFMREDARPILRSILANRSAGPIVLPAEKFRLLGALCALISKNAIPNLTKEQQLIRQRINAVRISMCGQGELDLQLRRIVNVGQITDDFAKVNYNDTFKAALMNNLTVGRSHDESAASVKTFKALHSFFSWMGPAATLGAPAWVALAKDVASATPFDWVHTVTVSNSRSKNQSSALSMQSYMDIIPVMMTAQAANVQTCLEVKADPTSPSAVLNQRDPSRPRGLLICGRMMNSAKVQEFFMVAYSRMSETSVTDPYNRLQQRLNLSLRGDRDISTFFKMVQGELNPVPGEKDITAIGFPEWLTPEALAYFARPPSFDQGIISSPVVFGRDHSVPSLLSKLWGNYSEDFKYLK